MSGIPEDIMVKAEALYDALGRGSTADAEKIARAILAERERAAKIALEIGDKLDPAVGNLIATAIRNGA